jgi:hypothetical protein
MSTGFFTLPRELRDEIYTHLWTSMPRILVPYTHTLRLRATFRVPFYPRDQCSSLPPGLSANRQLFHEALLAFHRKGTVHVSYHWDLISQAGDQQACLTPTLYCELRDRILSFEHEHCTGAVPHRVVRTTGSASAKILIRLIDDYTRIGSARVFRVTFEACYLLLELPRDFELGTFHESGRIAQGLDKLEIVVVDTDRGREETEFRKRLYREMKEFGEKTLGMKMEVNKYYMRYRGCTWRITFTKE